MSCIQSSMANARVEVPEYSHPAISSLKTLLLYSIRALTGQFDSRSANYVSTERASVQPALDTPFSPYATLLIRTHEYGKRIKTGLFDYLSNRLINQTTNPLSSLHDRHTKDPGTLTIANRNEQRPNRHRNKANGCGRCRSGAERISKSAPTPKAGPFPAQL